MLGCCEDHRVDYSTHADGGSGRRRQQQQRDDGVVGMLFIATMIVSSAGRGGMRSKFDTAKRCAEKGITTFIANGKTENIVLKLLADKEESTVFSL